MLKVRVLTFFFSLICLVSPSGTHTNKKLEISAFDSDFSFVIFIGFKNRRSHLKRFQGFKCIVMLLSIHNAGIMLFFAIKISVK